MPPSIASHLSAAIIIASICAFGAALNIFSLAVSFVPPVVKTTSIITTLYSSVGVAPSNLATYPCCFNSFLSTPNLEFISRESYNLIAVATAIGIPLYAGPNR